MGIGFASLAALVLGRTLFGGEDPLGSAPDDSNWHHEGITRRAAEAAGFGPEAENALAFHADHVDSYLYDPLWWMMADGGGVHRVQTALSSAAELVNVHFDDLFSTEAVVATWQRYLSGTVAGLLWVAGDETLPGPVSMAQNVVGTSLHAVQDFYAHSNWIDDPDRRAVTWFDVDPETRAGQALWTGSYGLPEHLGVKPHGAYRFACTVLDSLGSAGRALLRNKVCHAASPFADSELCKWVRDCGQSITHTPAAVPGVSPPVGVLWARPGINVDSRWQASTGAAERGIDLNGDEAFEIAYHLAYRASCQWLHILEHVMSDAGFGPFWAEVRRAGVSTTDYSADIAPWEEFDRLPYRFISAGPYPPTDRDDMRDWYVRLTIATADEPNAGTKANIVPLIGDVGLDPLGHGIATGGGTVTEAALGIDDFTAGSTASYVIGPLDELPESIALLNDAPSPLSVAAAALEAVGDALDAAWDAVVSFAQGLIGWSADFVAQQHIILAPDELASLGDNGEVLKTIQCDGASEGIYEVWVKVTATDEVETDALGVVQRRYRVRFEELICKQRSAFDRFTPSDEPFVLGLVIPHGGRGTIGKLVEGPFAKVKSGDKRDLAWSERVSIPDGYGFITVAVAIYESDQESHAARLELLNEFAGAAAETTAHQGFSVTIREAVGASWKVDRVDAVAFQRGASVVLHRIAPVVAGWWVRRGERLDVPLVIAETQRAAVPDRIDCGCEDVVPVQKRPIP